MSKTKGGHGIPGYIGVRLHKLVDNGNENAYWAIRDNRLGNLGVMSYIEGEEMPALLERAEKAVNALAGCSLSAGGRRAMFKRAS